MRNTVVPVKCIFRPVAGGSEPIRKSLKAGPVCGAFPLADDIVAFCDQISRAPEAEIGECSAEIGHECLDVVTAAARLVQGILHEHVGRGELIDDAEIAGLAPELGEPSADNGLVVLCLAHLDTLPCPCREATDRDR